MNDFTKEWEKEKRRQSRIDTQLAVLPPHQATRLDAVKRNLELALARTYGNRLDARVCQRIVDGVVLDPACLCTIGGGVNEMPTTNEGWDQYARQQAKGEPLAVLSIEASDAVLKEEIRDSELQSMRPERRLQLARAGTLDEHLNSVIASKLEIRAGV